MQSRLPAHAVQAASARTPGLPPHAAWAATARTPEQVQLRAHFGSASALRGASVAEIGELIGEGSGADPARVLSRLRARPERSTVGFHSSLTGHPSAVQALALSGRRANPQIEAWAAEEQARSQPTLTPTLTPTLN